MYRQLVMLIALMIWSATMLALPKQADAEIALTRAVVQSLRNLVQLMSKDRAVRPARVADAIAPGDALSTGRASLAELRFNDGSLARIGEQAVFRFVTKTRNFKLSNGTVLLLIPPGQGTTGVWTPNAAAAIRGSALFLRYIPETATTVVGALTNSNIEVFNQRASQRQALQAGQLAVIVKDKIAGLYNFDLKTFYETSDLVQGLNLNKKSEAASSDRAIALVQAETAAALAAQSSLTEAKVIVNPVFIRRPDNNQIQPALTLQEDSQNPFSNDFNSITNFLENGEISERENPQNLPNNEPSIDTPPSNGSGVDGGGVNNPGTGSGSGVDGGGVNNPGNGNGSGVDGGGVNNPGNGNGSGVDGGGVNNPGNGNGSGGNNGIGNGVGGGGINNPGNGNGNGNGNGGANNTGNNNRR